MEQGISGERRTRVRRPIGRRQLLAGFGGVATALALQSCTNDANKPGSGKGTGSAEPVEVTHAYGTTVVPPDPQRIIALGQTDLDVLVALDIAPVAVGVFSGDWYSPLHPWNESAFSEEPDYLNMEELEFEKIAALAPDLITCVLSGASKSDYQKLSKICPVVAQPKGYADWNAPMDQQAQLIATAVGKPDEATALVSAVDDAFAKATADHPEFSGLTSVCAERWGSDFDVLGATAPRAVFLQNLGFTASPELADLVGKGYSAQISTEKLALVGDLDLVLWTTDTGTVAKLKADPVVSRLASTTEGRSLYTTDNKDDDVFWAMDWSTVLSTLYAIEHAVPEIAVAVDDDPTTTPTDFSD